MPAFSKFMLLLMSEKQHLEDYGGYTLWEYTEILGMTSFIQRRKSKCALFQNQKGASDKQALGYFQNLYNDIYVVVCYLLSVFFLPFNLRSPFPEGN